MPAASSASATPTQISAARPQRWSPIRFATRRLKTRSCPRAGRCWAPPTRARRAMAASSATTRNGRISCSALRSTTTAPRSISTRRLRRSGARRRTARAAPTSSTSAATVRSRPRTSATFRLRAGWVAGDFLPYGFVGAALGVANSAISATVSGVQYTSGTVGACSASAPCAAVLVHQQLRRKQRSAVWLHRRRRRRLCGHVERFPARGVRVGSVQAATGIPRDHRNRPHRRRLQILVSAN